MGLDGGGGRGGDKAVGGRGKSLGWAGDVRTGRGDLRGPGRRAVEVKCTVANRPGANGPTPMVGVGVVSRQALFGNKPGGLF